MIKNIFTQEFLHKFHHHLQKGKRFYILTLWIYCAFRTIMALRTNVSDDGMDSICRTLIEVDHERICLVSSGYAVESSHASIRWFCEVHPTTILS